MQDRDDPWYTGIRRYRERDAYMHRERKRERERVHIETDLSIGTFLKCLLKVGM